KVERALLSVRHDAAGRHKQIAELQGVVAEERRIQSVRHKREVRLARTGIAKEMIARERRCRIVGYEQRRIDGRVGRRRGTRQQQRAGETDRADCGQLQCARPISICPPARTTGAGSARLPSLNVLVTTGSAFVAGVPCSLSARLTTGPSEIDKRTASETT